MSCSTGRFLRSQTGLLFERSKYRSALTNRKSPIGDDELQKIKRTSCPFVDPPERRSGVGADRRNRLELDGGIFSIGRWSSRCHRAAPKQSFKKRGKISSSKIEKDALPPTQMTSAKLTKIKLASSQVSSILLEKISFISFFHLAAEAPTAGRSRGRVCSFEVPTLVTKKCCRY